MQRIFTTYNTNIYLSQKSIDKLYGEKANCIKQIFTSITGQKPMTLQFSSNTGNNLLRPARCQKSIKSAPTYFHTIKNLSGLDFMCNYSTDSDKRRKTGDSQVTIDSFGAWDNNFELPLLMEASITYGKPIPLITGKDVGSSSELGKRTYQEDRFLIKEFGKDILCCAVFDGHGGAECSSFCVENIENILEKKLSEQPADLEHVLHDAILELNSIFIQWVSSNNKGERSGSTCTICLVEGGHQLIVGHVGDSRALLCRRGAPRRLTIDHCPSNITERNRVEQSGGHVITDNIGRHMVNGALSMSRSIGDLHLKQFGVSALPDTRKLEIKHGHDSFLLLTTDGINFVLNDEEICNIVNHAQDPETAARALTEQASTMSSEDNLTALIIPFGSWGNFAKSAASMFYSFGIGRDMSKSSRFG